MMKRFFYILAVALLPMMAQAKVVTGQVTDSLLTHAMYFAGSFDGSNVRSNAEISVTHDRLAHLLAADKLILHFGVDTDSQNVNLNLDNGIGLNLKADVIYGGSVDINQ